MTVIYQRIHILEQKVDCTIADVYTTISGKIPLKSEVYNSFSRSKHFQGLTTVGRFFLGF